MKFRPNQAMAYFVLSGTAAFSIVYVKYLLDTIAQSEVGWIILLLFGFKTSVEIVASLYGFAFIFGSVFYLLMKEKSANIVALASQPPVGIIYLCCDDLDPEALESLSRLQHDGQRYLIIHDDSKSEHSRSQVDAVAERVRQNSLWDVRVLRRKQRTGGKPGALNYVLEQTGHLYEFFLLCDNDSSADDVRTIEKALPYFQHDRIAIVQCRSVAVDSPHYSPVNRLLSQSINAFHVFFSVQSRFGWQPFIGHNAFLRTSAVRQVGGFTPGFFSDDLDITVRLNLQGYSVAYAPAIHIGEKHPPSYTAFRKRSYKWAFGCMQTLKAHAGSVLTSRSFSFAEKLSFFQFAGFYVGQTVLLFYLAVTLLIVPLVAYIYPISLTHGLFAGTLIVALIYLPTLVYFIKERKLRGCFGSLLTSGLVYGATDFSCARGVWDCILNRDKEWVPTNLRSHKDNTVTLAAEALYGALLLSISALNFPALLYLPCAWLFAGKFLFAPTMSSLYDDFATWATPRWRFRRAFTAGIIGLAVASVLMSTHSQAQRASSAGLHVEARDKNLYVDGTKFVVKGIHYGPWRPGTGPNKGYPYPSPDQIEEDFVLIKKLNANAILVFDGPEYVLDLAEEHGLKVLYCFPLNWWTIGSPTYGDEQQAIVDKVKKIRLKPALLAWVLGNEVPTNILAQRGEAPIRAGLEQLYRAVKNEDSNHPATHSNWPPAKQLDLSYLDFLSFNVYPLWPPEVVARGYGNYIKEVLQPIAGTKPLLITEFGANTIEAKDEGQSRLLKQSWEELSRADTAGGVAFEFADQSWKNYDNPRSDGDWWFRLPAPDDEKTTDRDPEETYGLVTSERKPKPAFETVSRMYAPGFQEAPGRSSGVWCLLSFLLLFAVGAWFWVRHHVSGPENRTKPSSSRV